MNAITRINQIMQAKGLANRSQFFLRLADHSDDACLIMQMKTMPTASIHLHADYQIEIIVVFNTPVDTQAILGQSATLELLYGGGLHPWHGIVKSVADAPSVGEHRTHCLVISSPLGLLKNHQHNRTFAHRDALSVATEVLQERLGHLCHITTSATPPDTVPFITQYHETDYDFVRRILAKEGITLHLSERADQTHIQLINAISETQEAETHITLPFRRNSGAARDADAISAIATAWHNSPQRLALNDYNPNTLENLASTHRTETLGQAGEAEHWGLNYETQQQGNALAERLAQHAHWRNSAVEITTTARAVRPGNRLTVTQHPSLSGDYHVIGVHFSGDQSARAGSSKGKQFQSIVTAIPAATIFVPEYCPVSQNAQLFTAHITEEVNTEGHYRFRYPFDHADHPQTSPPTRMMQPFGGANHGMHFPLEEGTEVVVSALNGNLDRPLIMGALYNRNSPNVVTQTNRRQNLIRTRAGHEFLLDDSTDKEIIQLNTPENLNRLRLDATKDQNFVELHTEEGDMELYAGQNIRIDVGKNNDINVGGDHIVEIQGDQQLLTEEGDISVTAGANIQMTAADAMHWQAHQGEARITTGANLTLQNEGMRTDQTSGGNYELLVESGNCVLQASGDVSLESAETLTLVAGNSAFQLTGSDVVIKADTVDITAGTIAVRGDKVGNN